MSILTPKSEKLSTIIEIVPGKKIFAFLFLFFIFIFSPKLFIFLFYHFYYAVKQYSKQFFFFFSSTNHFFILLEKLYWISSKDIPNKKKDCIYIFSDQVK